MKLTVIFDDDNRSAYEALNDLREWQRKMSDERRRHHDHTPEYQTLESFYEERSCDFADAVLDAACIWDSQEAES